MKVLFDFFFRVNFAFHLAWVCMSLSWSLSSMALLQLFGLFAVVHIVIAFEPMRVEWEYHVWHLQALGWIFRLSFGKQQSRRNACSSILYIGFQLNSSTLPVALRAFSNVFFFLSCSLHVVVWCVFAHILCCHSAERKMPFCARDKWKLCELERTVYEACVRNLKMIDVEMLRKSLK